MDTGTFRHLHRHDLMKGDVLLAMIAAKQESRQPLICAYKRAQFTA